MKIAELLSEFARECPNGMSFDPMAVRLLRQKVPFEDWQIENLKAEMFQLGNGLWYSCEMISDDEFRLEFKKQAREWLKEQGFFSVERLFKGFAGVFHHITTPEDCAAFLRHLGFSVAVWGKGGIFCTLSTTNLDDRLAAISETISGWLEEADGTLTLNEIEQKLPQLTAKALESIRVQLLPEVYSVEVGGVPCWCGIEAIPLPEGFSDKLTTVVDTLVVLKERVSVATLEFALNLFYRTRFREEYALLDNEIFMGVCAKHYQGGDDVFSKTKKSRARVRSPNTRFCNLGVPVGAELVFIRDSNICCTVRDNVNQVEYNLILTDSVG